MLTLTDCQLIHHLSSLSLTQTEIAEIIGTSQRSVSRILKKPLEEFVASSQCYEYFNPDALDSGCYRTLPTKNPLWEIQDYSDPTFDAVSSWEEEGED